MQELKIIETKSLDDSNKLQLLNLWNAEYPAKLCYKGLADFDNYLNQLKEQRHFLLLSENLEIAGWAFSFVRENEKWFAIILSGKIQGQGFGKKMLDQLKEGEKELNGWVIDHNRDKKVSGQPYNSPLEFYRKMKFEILTEQRLELEKLSAVKIRLIIN